MIIGEALEWGVAQISPSSSAFLESEILLASILRKKRVSLKTHKQSVLREADYKTYTHYINQRRQGIPVAYILGHVFWGDFQIEVNEKVLIPRDETEILCNIIVQKWNSNAYPQKILDVGTGSGCVALFLKRAFPQASVLAIDASLSALKTAQKNAQKQELDINMCWSDLLHNIQPKGHYDCIVANLPYLPQDMTISQEVQQEPSIALFSGKDGLNHIRRLQQQIQEKHLSYTELWLEFLPEQKEKIEHIFYTNKKTFFPDCGGDIFFAKIENKCV